MLFLSSSSVYVSDYCPGTLSSCAAEVDSTFLCLHAISVGRVVVRGPTSFAFRSVSGADNFLRSVRGSASANSAAYALISTLPARHTGAWSKGYTTDCSYPDILRTAAQALSVDYFKRQVKSSILIPLVLSSTRLSVMRLFYHFEILSLRYQK